MMWTATLIDIQRSESGSAYTIVYSDGVRKIGGSYSSNSLTDDEIKNTARNEIAKLDAATASVGKVTLVVGHPVDLTPPVPVVVKPTPEQQAKIDWLAAYRQLQALQRGVASSLIAPDDKRITDLQTMLKATWLDSYVEML